MSSAPKFKYHLETVFKFGKHKDESVKEVMASDPDYIHWCLENIDDFELSNRAFEALPDPSMFYSSYPDDLSYWEDIH